jgi:hypothetical protein
MNDPQAMTNTDENRRWLEDTYRELALRAHDRESEFFKTNNDAAIKAGEEAIKALTLINGGSSVAMLAFVGTMASKDQFAAQQIATLARPLIWFAFGVGFSVASAGLTYFANRAIAVLSHTHARTWQFPYIVAGEKSKRWRLIVGALQVLTVCVAALSLASFGWGVWTAKQTFEQLPLHAPVKPPQ